MESSTLRLASRPETPPQVSRVRWTRWIAALGILSLGISVYIARGMQMPQMASNGSQGQSAANPASDSQKIICSAVAYVDVEGGVRPLYPTVPGRVVQAPVPDGKEVEADTVLLQLDDSLAQARLNEAEVDLKAANEKLEQAKKLVSQHETRKKMQIASLNAAKEKNAAAEAVAKKARRLFDQNIGGSREDVDGASRLVNEAKALVDAENARLDLIKSMDAEAPVRLAQLEVDAKTKQVEKAKVGVRECKILAPTRGMILRRLVNVGEMIGQIPNRPAIEFCPAGDRIVRAEVEQEFAPSLKEGQKAEIIDEFSKNSKWEGEVIRISHWYTQRRTVLVEPTQFNDIRTLEVILRIKSGYSEPLRINQRVQVKFNEPPAR